MRKHNWKYVLSISVSAAALMALTACGSGAASTTAAATTAAATEAATTEAATTEAATTETATEAAQKTEKVEQTKPLVVYLNDFDAVIPDLFKEALRRIPHPDS